MDHFELIVTLLSFVYALALTHVLQGVSDLVHERDRVRFSLVHAVWMLLVVLLLLGNWLTLWPMRETPMARSAVLIEFLFAVLQYVFASLVTPRIPDHGPIDMLETNLRHGRIYALVGAGVAALDLLRVPFYTGGGATQFAYIADATIIALLILVAWRRERWVQLAVTVPVTVLVAAFLLI